MGSIILCHEKKARHPFEIRRIHRQIYTIEELCYYLCNHLYLIDYTLMNEALCEWLCEELLLPQLAQELRQKIQENATIEQCILTVLANVSLYTMGELAHIQDVLEQLKNQKPVEKQKYKADNLLASGGIRQAISIYQSILQEEEEASVERRFYGSVYACLGAAYGKLFLYEEAARMYEAAYQICEDTALLKAYLYASNQYLSEDDYKALLQKSSLYQKLHWEILETIQQIKEEVSTVPDAGQLLEWKEEYRGSGMSGR
ncbi:MAG: hypothetical protein UHS49_03150 [Faecalimonas sp.]|nr:hypothetical protein [Faecalimonas sp.]